MELLIDDVIVFITTYLNDKDKISFLSTTKKLNTLKTKVYYDTLIHVNKIKDLQYYDMFINVKINDIRYGLPKSSTSVNFDMLFDYDIKDYIHKNVTHMIFCKNCIFNQNIKDFIPNSVTHLTFGMILMKILKDVFLIQLHI